MTIKEYIAKLQEIEKKIGSDAQVQIQVEVTSFGTVDGYDLKDFEITTKKLQYTSFGGDGHQWGEKYEKDTVIIKPEDD